MNELTVSFSRLMIALALPALLGGCGDPARPRLKITLGQSACTPSCAAPQYEFMVIRSATAGDCALASRTANVGGGSIVLEGVEVASAEQVTVAARVLCPTPPGGCLHDCFAAQKVTASEGSVPLVLAQSTLPFCYTDAITSIPPACEK
jgi:hypothetical protein